MSGPKGASYTVVSAEELRRRAVAAARQRLSVAQERLELLTAIAGADAALAGRAPGASTSDDLDRLEAAIRAHDDHCRRLEEITRARQVREAAEQVRSSLAGLALDVDLDVPSPASPTAAPAPDRHADLRAELAKVAAAIAELPDADRATIVGRLAAAAGLVDSDDLTRAGQVVASLRGEAAAAVRLHRRREALDRTRQSLILHYADVADAAPDAWRAAADARDELALARARALLDDARAQASRRADQRFVLAQATAALRDLGYRVEVSDGDGVDEVVARKDAWSHHGLRLVFPETQGGFSSVPEAYGDTDARDDVAFEQTSCRDVAAMLERLQASGVDARLRTDVPAGTSRVRKAQQQATRRTAKQQKLRERAL